MGDLMAVEDYAVEEFVTNLQVENQQLKDRIAELERELEIAIECIECSGVDYDEATEPFREDATDE